MLKAEGYESQSFERKHAALFNCTQPDWVSAKKKMIGPIFASKEVLNLHAESVGLHTRRLLAIVGGGQPCDMSTIGMSYISDSEDGITDATQLFVSVST